MKLIKRNFIITTNRLEAFSDGVFAIVITLLAFQFKVPRFSEDASIARNFTVLTSVFPNIMAFIFSFAFIAVFWINHHQLYHTLKEINNKMLWLNMHVLFWITLIPFPILMVGDHPRVPLASMCLGFVLLMCSLAAYMVRRYSYFKARLVDESLSETSIQDGLVQNIIAICLALAGIITALFSVYISYWIYVLVLAMFVIPQKLEKKTHHP